MVESHIAKTDSDVCNIDSFENAFADCFSAESISQTRILNDGTEKDTTNLLKKE